LQNATRVDRADTNETDMTVFTFGGQILMWLSLAQGASLPITISVPVMQSTPDPRRDLIAILPALVPHSSLGANARLFDRFVGTWDAEYLTYGADGTVTRLRAEVIFGWIIDGRALQDVWITYPDKGTASDRNIGTTIRFFDARLAAWRVVWVNPSTGVLIIMTGGAVDDRIVLHGKPGDGSELRWSFNDIRPDSFVWRGEVSQDGGETWRLRTEYWMKRRGRPRADP
jgi:hypothetical protein